MKTLAILGPLARAVRWHRRKLAAVAAICCVLATISALSPAPTPTIGVVVASRQLSGGTTLGPTDLEVVQMPPSLAPAGALGEGHELVGRVLAAGVPAGLPLTEMAVVGTKAIAAKNELLVPVPVDNAAVLSLVQVGDRVTVVAAGQDGEVVTLAQRVRVASVTLGEHDAASANPSGLLLVACDQAVGARLAAWATGGNLGIALG